MRTIVCLVFLLLFLYPQEPKTFRVWVFSDAHVGSDQTKGRESLATALRQSEGTSGFSWDIALHLGDMSVGDDAPRDPEGQEIVRQLGVLRQHHLRDDYHLAVYYDRVGLE